MTPQQIIIYEWLRDHAPLTIQMTVRPDNIAPLENAIGEALASARAEGMREAARIAARHATGGPDWARHATAIESSILSAIGGQK